MPSLPASTAFTDSAVAEAGFKTAITNQREFLAGLLGTTGDQIDALKAMGVPLNDTVAKTGAYTVIAADRGVVFLCTNTFTLSLTAAATLGDGFTFAVINTGSGIITIDPNSTETIDGAATKTIAPGAWAIVSCNGTSFYTMGSVPGTGSLIGYQVFTTSGAYTKATNNPSFVIVEVVGGGGGITGAGGTSSFGAFLSATGGAAAVINTSGANGGVGSGGDINLPGASGQVIPVTGFGSIGSNTAVAQGGHSQVLGRGTGASNGGSAKGTNSGNTYASGAGGGYAREKITASSLAASETVTIGGAGAGAVTVAATAGMVIVWEYK